MTNCKACNKEFAAKPKHKQFCCRTCKERYRQGKHYTVYKRDKCDFCGFVPVDSCQLDVDHIDGDHTNNSIENLQTLCANCHRLKTKLNKEGLYRFR